MFHKEGYKIIIISTIILGIGIILIENLISLNWLNKVISLTLLVFYILILQFFRNPKRNTVLNDNNIIAPVDGKVVVIEEVFEKEYFKDKRIQVSIFMSPINVHVTRYPISGTINFSKYHPGKYLVAWHPKSSTLNERSTLVLENEKGTEILVRQIAGAVARRIVTYSEVGQDCDQGQEFGFIKFGSRIDLFLPLDSKIVAKIGDKTQGS
jgi:phosphatidylserine decarboxylase